MPLVIPNIESSPSFDGQAVPDYTDWLASVLTAQGTGVISGASVSPHSGSDMAVTVSAGVVVVASQQQYQVAPATAVIALASATDRRDLVIYTPGIGVETSGSGTTNSAAITGTPCGTNGWTRLSVGLPPIKPLIPAGSVLLAEVYVAGSTTAIQHSNLIDKTTLANLTGVTFDSYTINFGDTDINGNTLWEGFELFTPTTGDTLYDMWMSVGIPFNNGGSVQALFDWGQFTEGGTTGLLYYIGGTNSLWDTTIADVSPPGHAGILMAAPGNPTQWSAAVQSLAFPTGPPIGRSAFPFINDPNTGLPAPIRVAVSQDGSIATPTYATGTANRQISAASVVITTGVNDEFVWNGSGPNGGAAPQIIFTVSPGTYQLPTVEQACITAMNAAQAPAGLGHAPFSSFCGVGDNGSGSIQLTNLVAGGSGNGNFLSAGPNDASASFGFNLPCALQGGVGGSSNASQGQITVTLMIGSPS